MAEEPTGYIARVADPIEAVLLRNLKAPTHQGMTEQEQQIALRQFRTEIEILSAECAAAVIREVKTLAREEESDGGER